MVDIPRPLGPVQLVGIGWYRRGDWPALRALFPDRHLLPELYDDWLVRAEALERQVQASGKRVVRAEIRPASFAAWCTAHGHRPDAAGRSAWGAEAALSAHDKGR